MDVPTADLATETATDLQNAAAATQTDVHLNLSAAAQVVGAPAGDYIFIVDAHGGEETREADCDGLDLAWPAVHVAGLPEDRVTFAEGTVLGQWLRRPGDSFVANVRGGAGLFVLTSVGASDCRALAVTIGRLAPAPKLEQPEEQLVPSQIETPVDPAVDASTPHAPESAADKPPADALLRIVMRIRAGGEVEFSDVDWAGRLGKGRTIDAFMLEPRGDIAPADIEYKALTASGVETDWLAAGNWCTGPRALDGLAGFALRLKERASLVYECEYMGYFQSGTISAPVRNGTPCRSRLPRDLLEGIHIRLVAKASAIVETPGDDGQTAAPREARAEPDATQEIAGQADQMAEISAFATQLAAARAARAAGAQGAKKGRLASH